jgi:hypothetical protein
LTNAGEFGVSGSWFERNQQAYLAEGEFGVLNVDTNPDTTTGTVSISCTQGAVEFYQGTTLIAPAALIDMPIGSVPDTYSIKSSQWSEIDGTHVEITYKDTAGQITSDGEIQFTVASVQEVALSPQSNVITVGDLFYYLDLDLTVFPAAMGTATLVVTQPGTQIAICTECDIQTSETSKRFWNLSTETLPNRLYIWAKNPSTSLNDVSLKLIWTSPNGAVTEESELVTLTVIEVDVGQNVIAIGGDATVISLSSLSLLSSGELKLVAGIGYDPSTVQLTDEQDNTLTLVNGELTWDLSVVSAPTELRVKLLDIASPPTSVAFTLSWGPDSSQTVLSTTISLQTVRFTLVTSFSRLFDGIANEISVVCEPQMSSGIVTLTPTTGDNYVRFQEKVHTGRTGQRTGQVFYLVIDIMSSRVSQFRNFAESCITKQKT